VEVLLVIIPVRDVYSAVMHVMSGKFLTSLLSPDFGSKQVIPVVNPSGTLLNCSIIKLKFFCYTTYACGQMRMLQVSNFVFDLFQEISNCELLLTKTM
jgi:hypothetical protein